MKDSREYIDWERLVYLLTYCRENNIRSFTHSYTSKFNKIAIYGTSRISLFVVDEMANEYSHSYFFDTNIDDEKLNIAINHKIDPCEKDFISLERDDSFDLIVIADYNLYEYAEQYHTGYSNWNRIMTISAFLMKCELSCMEIVKEQIKRELENRNIFMKSVGLPFRENWFSGIENSCELLIPDENQNTILMNIIDYRIKNIRNLREKIDLRCYPDLKTELVNIENGVRHTLFNPSSFENSIYLIGSCVADSLYCSDEYTVASVLQKKLNVLFPNKYRVISRGGDNCLVLSLYNLLILIYYNIIKKIMKRQ